jgi:hypothetical protein
MFKKYLIYTTPLSILGFKRGIDNYDYMYKKNKDLLNNTYLYSTKTGVGIFVALCYINPFFLPFILCKEIYRLEVNIRNLEEEKKSDYYNRLL